MKGHAAGRQGAGTELTGASSRPCPSLHVRIGRVVVDSAVAGNPGLDASRLASLIAARLGGAAAASQPGDALPAAIAAAVALRVEAALPASQEATHGRR